MSIWPLLLVIALLLMAAFTTIILATLVISARAGKIDKFDKD